MPRRSIPFGMSLQQEYEVEKIIKTKYDEQLRTNVYLVKWKGYAEHLNTWEPEWNLENSKEILNGFKKKNKVFNSDESDNQKDKKDASSDEEDEEDYQPTKKAEKVEQKKKQNKRKAGQSPNVNTRGQNKKQSDKEESESSSTEHEMNDEDKQKYTRFVSRGRAKYAIKKCFKNTSGNWMIDFQQQQLGNVTNMCKTVDETLEYVDAKQLILYLLQKIDPVKTS